MNDFIKTILPWLGTALGGPLGGIAATTVGKVLGLNDNTVDNVKTVLNSMTVQSLTPEQTVALKQADYNFQVTMATLGYQSLKDLADLETQQVMAVNKTMQVEAASEHWPSYSWRPFNGFLFGITIFACYFVLPIFKIDPPEIPTEVWTGWAAILGIASFFRGKAQADPEIPAVKQIPAEHGVIKAILGQGK